MFLSKVYLFSVLFLFSIASVVMAQIGTTASQLGAPFSDHMVLQYSSKVSIWGSDKPNITNTILRRAYSSLYNGMIHPLVPYTLSGVIWCQGESDKVFHPAQATIIGNQVHLKNDKLKRAVAVRFAYHELAKPNLVNEAGLPAVAFRTDEWAIANLPKSAM